MNKSITKARLLKKANGKVLAICNYCHNLVSPNKLHECHSCRKHLQECLDKKLKIDGEIMIKDKTDLEKIMDKNIYCESCSVKIRDDKYLCPECLLKFHKNNVIFLIENY